MITCKLEAVVEYDYEAEQDDELTLKVGDIIKNVQTAEGGWWEGEKNGKRGMFPENFVKLVSRREAGGKTEGKREATQRKSVRVLAEKFKDGIPMGGAPPKKKEKKKMCKVLFDYKKENDDELDLTMGDLVEFHKQVEEGWWEGTLNGKHGVFPSNFVEMIEDPTGSSDDSTPTPASAPTPSAEDKTKTDDAKPNEESQVIKGKKVVGVGLGNIFGSGPIKLRPTGNIPGKKQEEVKPVKPEPESVPEVTKREKQSTLERAVVRFSYTAEQPDELSLVEGQIVRVIERQLEDDGWWKGEVNGKVGVFPDNFVEILPPEEPNKLKKPPPPPSAASKQNIQSKLPSVDAADDRSKPEPVAPAIGKKPQPPPILGKKPGSTKQEPPRPAMVKSTSKDNNVDNRSSNSEEAAHFDNLEGSGQKLTHLTANRAKGPKKRPPSTVLTLNDMEKDGDSMDEVKPNSHPPERPEKPHLLASAKEHKHPSEPEPPSLSHHHHQQPPHTVHTTSTHREPPSHPGGSAPPRPPEPASGPAQASNNAHINKLIESMQREIAELRTNSVSRAAFNELRADYERLKGDFETMRAAHSKKFRELINEVDEEKKLRLTTQVEIERVKKFMAETNV